MGVQRTVDQVGTLIKTSSAKAATLQDIVLHPSQHSPSLSLWTSAV